MNGLDLGSVAAAHAAAGFPVFPLLPGRKTPATRTGVHSATRDPERIRGWWSRNSRLNVGVATGDGVLVIDLDPTESGSGFAELAAYASRVAGVGPGWLNTYSVTTPRLGVHLYYKAEDTGIGNRVSVLPGVDVRTSGGYVVGGYSETPERGYRPEYGYTETVEVLPDGRSVLAELRVDMLDAPEWLLDLITRPKHSEALLPGPVRITDRDAYLAAVLDGEAERIKSAKPGNRNNTLNVAAYRLGRHVAAGRLTDPEAEAWLIRSAHQSVGGDDFTDAEIRLTVRSGLDGGIRDGA